LIKRYGAAVLCDGFDEGDKQITMKTYKFGSYDILVGIVSSTGYHLRFKHFPVATGMEEHRLNALDFLEEPSGFEKILHTLIGGVSNVSFSFRVMSGSRGNALCFFVSCHSKRNDNGDCKSRNVVNLVRFQRFIGACRDVILDRRDDDATERLLDFAEK
jgi:5-methyltetrahydrofolate--homocysteine methyltransferase